MSIFVDHQALKHLLKKLKDVLITSPTDGQVLTYETASKKWKNKAPVAGIDYQTVYGTTAISTSSQAFVDMDQMTITLAKAGTYMIFFNLSYFLRKTTTEERNAYIRLLKNGSQFLSPPYHILTQIMNEGNSPSNYCTAWALEEFGSFALNDVLKVQWQTQAPDTTLLNYPSLRNWRRLTVVRLGS